MGGGRKMSSSAMAGCANKPAGREQAAPIAKKNDGRNDKKNNPDNYNPNPNFCMCFTAHRQKSAIRRGSEARASKRKPDRTPSCNTCTRSRPWIDIQHDEISKRVVIARARANLSRHILCRFSFLNLRRRIFLSKGSQIPKSKVGTTRQNQNHHAWPRWWAQGTLPPAGGSAGGGQEALCLRGTVAGGPRGRGEFLFLPEHACDYMYTEARYVLVLCKIYGDRLLCLQLVVLSPAC